MLTGILKESGNEKRVAMLPESVAALVKMKAEVIVENSAGNTAFANDESYKQAGATVASRDEILQKSDLVICIAPLSIDEIKKFKANAVFMSVFQPFSNHSFVQQLAELNISTFSMDAVPRTTRAQAMDILSSTATVSGYQAVLMAATYLPKFFPMFMTAAGTITPSKVLILGAGVAGLQAIATSKKLGAVVEAFDVRAAAKEEVMSLGAKFVEVEGAKDEKSAGGYAVEQTEEFKQKQKQKIHEHASKADVIICTAQIPGRKAPLLIQKETVEAMKAGSVIIDMAASTGGNCALTKNDEMITTPNGVLIIGNSNLAGMKPSDASKMFGKNVLNFLKLIIDKDGKLNLNFADDIVKGTCITHNKEIVNERVKSLMSQKV